MTNQDQAFFESLRDRAVTAFEQARLEESLQLFDEALAWAEEHGCDEALVERTFCNHAAVAIELYATEEPLPQLRQILMRNQNLENCFLAAYNVARVYEIRKQFKKGLFYARIARDLAQRLEREDWVASSRNRIGNCLLAESYFDEAYAEYREALALFGSIETYQRAILLENVGYCRIVQGHSQEGFQLLFESLRSLRRLDLPVYQSYPHLSLCYAYLEIGRHDRALRHGQRALALAHAANDREAIKNALYLLGEAAKLSGDPDAARDYLLSLQEDYYPDSPEIVELLLSVSVRNIVNIKA